MQLITWYQNKSSRDKKLLFFLIIFLCFFVMFFSLYYLNKQQDILLEEINYYQNLNSWITSNKPNLYESRQNIKMPISGSVFANVDQAFQKFSFDNHGIEIKTIDNSQVSVSLKQAPFNDILNAISKLNQKNIIVERIEIQRSQKSGWVSATMLFGYNPE